MIAEALNLAISFSRLKFLEICYNTISIIMFQRKNATNRQFCSLAFQTFVSKTRNKEGDLVKLNMIHTTVSS